ncbi:MAG: endonuclease/exonuclease/phosphatase family protein [Actinobacteria bacterium]|nr:endonuclease/exonuclease/phosphatase family protein [Actinomycetota bacterium]
MGSRAIVEERGSWLAPTLVALSLVLLSQLVRAFVPLSFELGEEIGGARGYVSAGAIALAVFASPALAAVGRLPARGRIALVVAVALLGGARLAIQFVHPIPVWLGTLAVAAGLFAVPIVVGAVRRVADDGALLVGVYVGLALDTAIRAGALTWDVAWQDGAPAAIVAIEVASLAAAAAVAVPSNGGLPTTPPALRLAAFGPFFALQILFLQNPAALASQAGLSLPVAAAAVLLIDAAVLAVGSLRARVGPYLAAGLMALAGVGGYLLVEVEGPSALILFGVEQVVLALLMGRALISEPSRPVRPARLAWSCALGSLAFVAVVFAYQVAIEVPLPFSKAFVPAAAAVVVGLSAVPRRGTIAFAGSARAAAVPLVLIALPALVGFSAPELGTSAAEDATVRILVYNIHGGVNVDGQVDPEATALAIEAQRPDVVVLNEVGRGWPIFGTLDAAEWLARRLGMPYLFEPAADLQFGNAILSRLPVVASSGGELPFGAGPQQRSYLSVTFDVEGRELVVIGTHLQESASDPQTRTRQVEFLIDAWDGVAPAIVAGDMNMQPGEQDMRLFLDAGLVSVQDAIGDPCEPTAYEPKPEKPCDRPDWVFATPDLGLADFVIERTPASDHLPIAVTVTVED